MEAKEVLNGKERDLFSELRTQVMQELETEGEASEQALYRIIDQRLEWEERKDYLPLASKLRLREQLFNSFRKLDILQELLDDDRVTEIMINGPENVFIERSGKICRWERKFESSEKLEHIIQQIVSRVNRRVNTASPIVDARLEEEPILYIRYVKIYLINIFH